MFSFKCAVSILLIVCVAFSGQVVNSKSIFGIGMRIINDQLLLKDALQARSGGIAESAEIDFRYAIPEPITYIEIISEENVYADVHFSYHNSLVQGSVKATGTQITKSFMVIIRIYGFNETMLNINPALLINRDRNYEGTLEPEQSDAEYLDEIAEEFDETQNENNNDYVEYHAKHDANEDDFENYDKIIEIGERQTGDYLLYDTYQTSPEATENLTNHSVIFYYIDSNYITYVKFVIFDHFVDETSPNYQPPVAEYSHFSPTTLKTVITNFNTTSLIVRMYLYGYEPIDIPHNYKFFLPNRNVYNGIGMTEAPKTTLQQLMTHINALPLDITATELVHTTREADNIMTHSDVTDSAKSLTLQATQATATILSSLVISFTMRLQI